MRARSNSRYNNKFQSFSSVIGPIVISTEITTAAQKKKKNKCLTRLFYISHGLASAK